MKIHPFKIYVRLYEIWYIILGRCSLLYYLCSQRNLDIVDNGLFKVERFIEGSYVRTQNYISKEDMS